MPATCTELSERLIFRCTAAERNALLVSAEARGETISQQLRRALGHSPAARRRRPPATVDPSLVRELARLGSNLNQIARWLNRAAAAGVVREIDALAVAAEIAAIDRTLTALLRLAGRRQQETGSC